MRNILLISPEFFDYQNDILQELENQGNKVFWFSDRPSSSFFVKAVSRLNKNVISKSVDKYVETIVNSLSRVTIDVVLIIFGQSFSPRHIIKMRKAFRKAVFIYYVWDSIKNFGVIRELSPLFDKTFSFDPVDAHDENYVFLPLFFPEKRIDKQPTIDFSAVLTIKPGKLDNFRKIQAILPKDVSCYFYLFLQSRFVFLYYKIKDRKEFRNWHMNSFTYKRLERVDYYNIIGASKVVIDCQMKNQNGLTMRTFETLHNRRKLITTNSNVKNYDFYCPSNILIVDDDTTPEAIQNFLQKPFDNRFDISDGYSLREWVKKLISDSSLEKKHE
jgi:hypothetical protein